MRFERTKVFGVEAAILGMRLPMCKSLDDVCSKSESIGTLLSDEDISLAKRLIGADKNGVGQPNSKFLRMIHVQVFITAPLAFFKELDTYKVSTVCSSTSTMHRLTSYPIDESCFEPNPLTGKCSVPQSEIARLEALRQKFNTNKDKSLWYDLIYSLPDSWLQTRLWDANYETLRNIWSWRCRIQHKQNCWSGNDNPHVPNFKSWIESLPFAGFFITGNFE